MSAQLMAFTSGSSGDPVMTEAEAAQPKEAEIKGDFVVNSKGGRRAGSCAWQQLGGCQLPEVQRGGAEQLENPRQWRRGQAAWSGASFSQQGN